jgi:hypothetical protein
MTMTIQLCAPGLMRLEAIVTGGAAANVLGLTKARG